MYAGLYYFWNEFVLDGKVEKCKVYFIDYNDAEQAMHDAGLKCEISFETVKLKVLINELNRHREQEALDRLNSKK